MIRSLLYEPEARALKQGGSELLEQWRNSSNAILWLDICKVEETEEVDLLTSLGFHELAIQDALRRRHPPKIEVFPDYLFLMLRDLVGSNKGIQADVSQLAMFCNDRLLVTRHAKASVSVDSLISRIEKNPGRMAEGAVELMLTISNHLIRRYVRALIDFETRLDEIESEMFERPNDRLLAELTGYKSNLRHITRNARYHRLIANELRNETPALIGEDFEHEIIDFYEQVERTQSLASLYYDVLKDLSDGYLALSSHRLNKVMQVLTVITVIFVPLTFIAGIYGMNFEYMPELSFRRSYFIILGVMLTAAVTQLLLFKKKGWL